MLSEFGKIIRKARIETGETLSTMAKALGKTVSFLSAIETGVKKIPLDIVPQIQMYLISKGANAVELENLLDYANIANDSISLSGLEPSHKKMMATFARSELSQKQIDCIMDILNSNKG
jgi:conserved hypothetical DNA-binding protein|uniref:Helix-turn-helix domain protein n=1 Tax=Myoviridae sp. ctKHS5 TaxID=2823541 RepID=A0A8S5L7W2_9CAUD|nr:MAG TPA: helix-turn-helix domain protein [Myoviridae sp. ctKHS5]